MNDRDRSLFLTALWVGRMQFLNSLCCLSEDAAMYRTAPGCWSILECAEHAIVAERFYLEQIQSAEEFPAQGINKLRESAILLYGSNRSIPAQAPDELCPAGRFASLSEAVQGFLETREATIRFVALCRQDLRTRRVTHKVMGPLSAHETLLLISCHADRHRIQMQEVRRKVCTWQRDLDAGIEKECLQAEPVPEAMALAG
jgi:uncharacterized damage-inducible protein DinB